MFVSLWGMSSLKSPGVVSKKTDHLGASRIAFYCQKVHWSDGRNSAKWILIISTDTNHGIFIIYQSYPYFIPQIFTFSSPPVLTWVSTIKQSSSKQRIRRRNRMWYQLPRGPNRNSSIPPTFLPFPYWPSQGENFLTFSKRYDDTQTKGWWWEGTAYICIYMHIHTNIHIYNCNNNIAKSN